ncbi:ABC transporter ATP-binding protein [Sediminibacterium ginsengisoli]|uniref:ABC-2 type transport system ATP-binding protein n=1 Tax=Sediminibacterium ginsengisoli TaxID=413434 RepID=A0A1T4JXM6_9BACT|nr:ABC transporter ATP-binding protein [Sediminibacterium ginsengisoli]SJZ34950.1 ABC-2 type transport system ATP-binding protein [Sediminibacterium ginsengisoli]
MIHFSSVHFGYRKKQSLYRDLKLEVEAGHIYGLLGKNGAGKSTLLKLISGLVFPVNGKVQVMGYEPRKRQPSFLEKIFFIPEEIETPDINVTVFADDYAPFYPRFDKQLFLKLLTEFDVPLKSLKQMSYGQKKKTWIALGIAANTELLILDEPTNGLDIPSKRQFRKMMAAAMTDERCVIISTHQVRDLDHLIDSILIVDEGSLLVNAGIDTITEKLAFVQFSNEADAAGSIYTESNLMGTSAVMLNKAQRHDSRMDIELFFNAVTENSAQMKSLFTN